MAKTIAVSLESLTWGYRRRCQEPLFTPLLLRLDMKNYRNLLSFGFGIAAIAFTLVGPDAATTKGDRDRLPARGQPAPARIAGRALNPDRGKWPIARTCLVSA